MKKDAENKAWFFGQSDLLQTLERWTNIQEAAVISRSQKRLVENRMSQIGHVITLNRFQIWFMSNIVSQIY